MSSEMKGSPPVEGAVLVDPGILSADQESGMPRMSDVFAPTPFTAAAYFVPAIIVLIFGLDWTVFGVCIGYELILFLWARVIQMWIMPGGPVAAIATLFMLPAIGMASFGCLFILALLLSGEIEVNYKIHEITIGSRLTALLAVAVLSADAVHRFRHVTIPRIRFMQRVNARYMFEGEPNRALFDGQQTVAGNVFLSFFGGALGGLYFGSAWLIMTVLAAILGVFISKERALATGAVIGFSAVRLVFEAFRANVRYKAGPLTMTEAVVLDRLAVPSQKRIVLRDSGETGDSHPPGLGMK